MCNLKDKTLQELIKDKKLKQKELAVRLGIHESTISLKISGQRELSIEEAGIIADMLDTTLEQIRHALSFAKCKENNFVSSA